jgi:hypothetical protein
MTKVAFFYCVGTSWAFNVFSQGVNREPLFKAAPGTNSAVVAGLNGNLARWDGGPPSDPFPSLLDANIFDAKTIPYQAATIPMNTSINDGISRVVTAINSLPAGQPFCLGGYSQGAAVMTGAASLGLLPGTSGALSGRASSFLGATMFGNPRRANNHRGAVGGTWNGNWTGGSGSHGSFPTTGPHPRLSSAPSNWVEFAHPNDIFNTVGDSTLGQKWVEANGIFLTQNPLVVLFNLLNFPVLDAAIQAINLAGNHLTMTDGAGTSIGWLGGNGHTAYPFQPPYEIGGVTTYYQTALAYLTSLAQQFVTGPILGPINGGNSPVTAGWSTTLTAPSA